MPTLFHPSRQASGAAFTAQEFAFALAWEIYAPGLGGWTVQRDSEEDGGDLILVDPPLVYGDGFVVQKNGEGVSITSALGLHRAASLRDGLLLICPLGREALDAADRMAALPIEDLL